MRLQRANLAIGTPYSTDRYENRTPEPPGTGWDAEIR